MYDVIVNRVIFGIERELILDRFVSVEMMEHVRNRRPLLNRIHSWMAPEGKMLVHVFCHQRFT